MGRWAVAAKVNEVDRARSRDKVNRGCNEGYRADEDDHVDVDVFMEAVEKEKKIVEEEEDGGDDDDCD